MEAERKRKEQLEVWAEILAKEYEKYREVRSDGSEDNGDDVQDVENVKESIERPEYMPGGLYACIIGRQRSETV